MLLLHRLGLTSAAAASVVAGSIMSAAAAPAGLHTPHASLELDSMVLQAHGLPLKGSKRGGTWGYHKQCLYGVYGSQGQYKGYHSHYNQYDRGHACAPYLNPGAALPAKLFRDPPPSHRSPRLR